MPTMLVGVHPPRERRRYCDRQRDQGDTHLMEYYFVKNPIYDECPLIHPMADIFNKDVMPPVEELFHSYRNVRELCVCWCMVHQQMHVTPIFSFTSLQNILVYTGTLEHKKLS
uniref:Uncharacterized protein n=1 Tax=Lactuca sativa TaxID=4236 RepID=A0A9R1XAU8_LACSA|nr:hypothetical protein LSAT_V11C500260220 [Lactuca sativa]